MNIEEMLNTRRVEINQEIAKLDEERRKIDGVLAGLVEPTVIPSKEEAIIEAVRVGNKRPTTIHNYIKKNMRMNMNIGSLRSTLSRLKSEGRISRNDDGWIM